MQSNQYPEEVKKFLDERAKLARAKRWAKHAKLSEDDKKAKRAEYMREYRRKKKEKNDE